MADQVIGFLLLLTRGKLVSSPGMKPFVWLTREDRELTEDDHQ